MAKYYDITNWNEKPFFNTKGTRNKCVVSDPSTGIDYYFKTSMIKDGKKYYSEFWSEIIASEIGRFLGFNVLEYNIAKHGIEIGCISESMNTDEECLTEGISLLTGYDNTYHPESKSSYSNYTFHFIKEAITSFGFDNNIDDIIRTIIFDSIIGNSDRHQENWGFITPYKDVNIDENILSKISERFKLIRGRILKKVEISVKILTMKGTYAPIYDSGCCLARERTEDAVSQMLRDECMLNSFVDRGKSEIHWGENGVKLNHFDLIKNIRLEFRGSVDQIINNVISLYDENKIHDIIFNIDENLPSGLSELNHLTLERKELIFKIIQIRILRLKELLS